jgi:hypothetical protein
MIANYVDVFKYMKYSGEYHETFPIALHSYQSLKEMICFREFGLEWHYEHFKYLISNNYLI